MGYRERGARRDILLHDPTGSGRGKQPRFCHLVPRLFFGTKIHQLRPSPRPFIDKFRTAASLNNQSWRNSRKYDLRVQAWNPESRFDDLRACALPQGIIIMYSTLRDAGTPLHRLERANALKAVAEQSLDSAVFL